MSLQILRERIKASLRAKLSPGKMIAVPGKPLEQKSQLCQNQFYHWLYWSQELTLKERQISNALSFGAEKDELLLMFLEEEPLGSAPSPHVDTTKVPLHQVLTLER